MIECKLWWLILMQDMLHMLIMFIQIIYDIIYDIKCDVNIYDCQLYYIQSL